MENPVAIAIVTVLGSLTAAAIGGITTLIVTSRREQRQQSHEQTQAERDDIRADRERLIEYYEAHTAYLQSEVQYWRGVADANLDRYARAIGLTRDAANALEVVIEPAEGPTAP